MMSLSTSDVIPRFNGIRSCFFVIRHSVLLSIVLDNLGSKHTCVTGVAVHCGAKSESFV